MKSDLKHHLLVLARSPKLEPKHYEAFVVLAFMICFVAILALVDLAHAICLTIPIPIIFILYIAALDEEAAAKSKPTSLIPANEHRRRADDFNDSIIASLRPVTSNKVLRTRHHKM